MDMTKGAATPLVNDEGAEIRKLYIGVGWDVSGQGTKGLMGRVKRKHGLDLDAAAIAFDYDDSPIRMAWFDNLNPFGDGSLTLSGDNTTGRGDGDDEFITADLDRVPREVKTLVFLVSAFKQGVSFAKAEGVTCRVVDRGSGEREVGKFFPPIDSTHNAIVLSKAVRNATGGWTHTVIKTMGTAATSPAPKQGLINLARTHLS